MLLTSVEDELTKDFISVNSRLISLTDTKFFSSSTLSRSFRASSTLGDDVESASLAVDSQDSQSQPNPSTFSSELTGLLEQKYILGGTRSHTYGIVELHVHHL